MSFARTVRRRKVSTPTGPGPQYLHLLDYDRSLNRKEDRELLYGMEDEDRQLRLLLGDLFEARMNINNMGCLIKSGISHLQKFPRELVWYYGVYGLLSYNMSRARYIDSSCNWDGTKREDLPKSLSDVKKISQQARPNLLTRL